jgi:hypothetical protein
MVEKNRWRQVDRVRRKEEIIMKRSVKERIETDITVGKGVRCIANGRINGIK